MLSVSHNIRHFERGLSDMARRQLPFAIALALNDTGGDVQEAWRTHLTRRLDRPTPFTLKGTRLRRAKKSRQVATVAYKDIQAGYLRFAVTGGTRRPKGRAIVVPVNARRNKYGNLPRGSVRKMLARDDVFSGRVRGVEGIWQRPKRSKRKVKAGPKLLAAYEPSAEYTQRLDLGRAAEGRARQAFPRHFAIRFRQALATARR